MRARRRSLRIRRRGRLGRADSERFLRSSTEAAGLYRRLGDPPQVCAVRMGESVGASTPPARSTVVATTEPVGTLWSSGTIVIEPPPLKIPALIGFEPGGITQAS